MKEYNQVAYVARRHADTLRQEYYQFREDIGSINGDIRNDDAEGMVITTLYEDVFKAMDTLKEALDRLDTI